MMDSKEKMPAPVTIKPDEMAVHLSYVRRDVDEIKILLKDMRDGYVTRDDFNSHLGQDEDHEKRIRSLEEGQTSALSMIKTWGSIGGVILAGLQIVEIAYTLTHLPK